MAVTDHRGVCEDAMTTQKSHQFGASHPLRGVCGNRYGGGGEWRVSTESVVISIASLVSCPMSIEESKFTELKHCPTQRCSNLGADVGREISQSIYQTKQMYTHKSRANHSLAQQTSSQTEWK